MERRITSTLAASPVESGPEVFPVSEKGESPGLSMGPGRRMIFGLCGSLLFFFLLTSIIRASLSPPIMFPLVVLVYELTIFRPRWGLYSAMAALPLLTWIPGAFHSPYFVPDELLTYGLLAGWLTHRALRPSRQWHRSPLDAWLLVLVLLVLFSLFEQITTNSLWSTFWEIFVHHPAGGLRTCLTVAYEKGGVLFPLRTTLDLLVGLLFFCLVVQIIEDREDRRRAIQILVGVSLMVSAYGIFQYIFKFHLLRDRFVQSTLAEKNTLAGYLVVILGLWFGQWRGAQDWMRAYLLCVLGALLGCLVCASSRTGWIAGLFVVSVFAFLSLRNIAAQMRAKVGVAVAIVVLLTLAGLVYRALRFDVKSALGEDVSSNFWFSLNPRNSLDVVTKGRVRNWQGAVEAFAEAPITGIGIGRLYSSQYILRRSGQFEFAHNYFLQIAAELGLVGLIVWIGLLMKWFASVWRRWRSAADEEEGWTHFGIILGISGYLLTWLTDHYMTYTEQQIIFWCVMGLGASVHPAGGKLTTRQKLWLLGLGVLLLASVPFRHPLPWPQSLR